MLVEELIEGRLVNLEFTMNEEKYEVTTRVIGTTDNAVLIEPIEYQNKIVTFGPKTKKSMVFNLFGDDENRSRVGWYNVDVDVVQYKGHSYYAVHTKNFNCRSVSSERRKYARMNLVGVRAYISCSDGTTFSAMLNDVSGVGLSFFHDELDFPHRNMIIEFEDKVNEEEYSVKVTCNCVRVQKVSGTTLYGCQIPDADRKYLSYLFFKKIFLNGALKEEQMRKFSE